MDTKVDVNDLFIFKRTCGRCSHKWFPRSGSPQRCPRCQVWLENEGEGEGVPEINEVPPIKME